VVDVHWFAGHLGDRASMVVAGGMPVPGSTRVSRRRLGYRVRPQSVGRGVATGKVRQVSPAFVGRTPCAPAYQVGPLWVYFSYPLLPWTGIMLVWICGSQSLSVACETARQSIDLRRQRAGDRVRSTPSSLAYTEIQVRGALRRDNLSASVMSFLATTKYPPSLLYTLMTLDPPR